ncbi:MAG: TIM barrel protein [Limisphaerales bacterium]
MKPNIQRRQFLKQAGLALGALSTSPLLGAASAPLFEVSLAEWSLHKALFAGKMDHLNYAKVAKSEFGIHAVEYVNQFFKDKATDANYLKEMRTRAEGEGVRSLLIMIDGEGNLGDADPAKRQQAVKNHHKWVEAAKFLGCHSIRVNAATGNKGSYEDQMDRAADGLSSLASFAAPYHLGVIVENHGGLSSNGAWLSGVMKKVGMANCGTLPDFGNFRVSNDQMYDRYKGVKELMPHALAVSAKSHDFNEQGDEIHTDYRKMMKIVLAAGYNGFVGIEYEGSKLSEMQGIQATKDLLVKVREELS